MSRLQVYPGEHQAIVDEDLFSRVQQRLDANARRHRTTTDRRLAKAPLSGKLFDATGAPMSPSFSRGRSGRAYRYYVSAAVLQGGSRGDERCVRRLSAPAIEGVLSEAVERWLRVKEQPLLAIRSVRLVDGGLVVEVSAPATQRQSLNLLDGERVLHQERTGASVHLPLALPLRGGRPLIAAGARRTARPDPTLIAALRKTHRMTARDGGTSIVHAAPVSPYERRILRLAFLAPDLQRDILAGLHPPGLNLERLMENGDPSCLGRAARRARRAARKLIPVMAIKRPVMVD